jgi:hypothetical protein
MIKLIITVLLVKLTLANLSDKWDENVRPKLVTNYLNQHTEELQSDQVERKTIFFF